MRIPLLGAIELALEKVGTRPYTQPQTFEVEYRVQLKNVADTAQQCVVVIPGLRSGGDQSILRSSAFIPETAPQVDPVWRNPYAAWRLELPPQGIEVASQSFTVQVRPSQDYSRWENLVIGDRAEQTPERLLALQPNAFIHPTRPDVQELAQRIAGSERRVVSVLERLNAYVSENIVYGNPIPGLYSDERALRERVVDCGGFASLYCSLAISLGIPSRIVSGFWAGYENNGMHAWAESLLPSGLWIPVDPSIENLRQRGATRKSGRFGYLGSDRIVLSRGCDITIEVFDTKIKADILQNPIVVPDLGTSSVETSFGFTTQVR